MINEESETNIYSNFCFVFVFSKLNFQPMTGHRSFFWYQTSERECRYNKAAKLSLMLSTAFWTRNVWAQPIFAQFAIQSLNFLYCNRTQKRCWFNVTERLIDWLAACHYITFRHFIVEMKYETWYADRTTGGILGIRNIDCISITKLWCMRYQPFAAVMNHIKWFNGIEYFCLRNELYQIVFID